MVDQTTGCNTAVVITDTECADEGRAEFDGKNRQEVLREACPDPDRERRFTERLHADHSNARIASRPGK